MRPLRVLAQGVWYEVRTGINNQEPLFRRCQARAIFTAVFRKTMLRFLFEIRDLRVEDDRLSFYIRPQDGLELPDIIKWMKQVFAQRYNAAAGRSGHIWGDRYWSRILEGEPVEGEAIETSEGTGYGDRPRKRGKEGKPCFPPAYPPPPSPSPG